jgi:hypothetical protein
MPRGATVRFNRFAQESRMELFTLAGRKLPAGAVLDGRRGAAAGSASVYLVRVGSSATFPVLLKKQAGR